MMKESQERCERFFHALTSYPKTILIIGIVLIILFAAFIPTIKKDTSADAFIASDNPALIYRDEVKKTFGLEDPFVVAVVNQGELGIYNPQSLALVAWLTDKVKSLPNIDPDKVTSLATEKDIRGTSSGMEVEKFFDTPPDNIEAAGHIREAIENFPLYQGSLVARNHRATLIIAEPLNEKDNKATYDELMRITKEAPASSQDEIFVAGEGAASGYLGDYIDHDMQRLNPVSGLVISLMLLVAFRSLRGVLVPNIIVIATVASAVGSMAAFGVSFYVITNGLVAILIAIAVADSIHIFSQYYTLVARDPNESQHRLVVMTMKDMWQPVTLTTFTTIGGFAGLYLSSSMPPMRYFGLFAGVGVFVAWIYSIIFMPALLMLLKPKSSSVFTKSVDTGSNRLAPALTRTGQLVLSHPILIVAVSLIIACVGGYGASKVMVEDQRITNFQSDEPIYIADKAINRHMDGLYNFDIVVETPGPEGLFDPAHLRRIEALQRYAETLPHVNGSTSVVDYIKQMHKAINEGRGDAYTIPDDPALVAQLFLLYSASGDPTDFEEEVDYDYRQALVRLNVNIGSYQINRELEAALQNYLENEFNTDQIKAILTGRLKLDYHWIDNIAANHISSMLVSLLMVWAMASLLFRSALAGVFALLPVCAAILLVYAVMGFGNIWLGVGTSMFAAIGIGVGVDFSIHTIDKLRELVAGAEDNLDELIADLYPSTGRALMYNCFALALGFLVLYISKVPSLMNFGVLVAIATSAAFVTSVTLLPALAKLLRPKFLTGIKTRKEDRTAASSVGTIAGYGLAGLLSTLLLTAIPDNAHAQSPEKTATTATADQIIREMNLRNEGNSVVRDLRMELTDGRGTKRTRETRFFRKYFGDVKRTVIFYQKPAIVKGTAFLIYDYAKAERDDDQWLYLPALRKVRRISASDRGDYFLGTDFTYEDIKNENKVDMKDYQFKSIGIETVDNIQTTVVEGTPVDKATARELGYGRVIWYIDRSINFARKIETWDVNQNKLKTTSIENIVKIDDIWTAQRLHVINHKTNHQTIFKFNNVEYDAQIPDKIFTKQSLRRGFF